VTQRWLSLSAQHATNKAAGDGWWLQYVILEDLKLQGMLDCERDSRDKLCCESEIKPIDYRIYLSMSMLGLSCVALIFWDRSVDKF
jgi:hypothetical protein